MKNLLLVLPTPECYSNETTWHGARHKDPVVALNVATLRNLCLVKSLAVQMSQLLFLIPRLLRNCASPPTPLVNKLIVLILPQTFHFRNNVRPSS